jgi:tetratricopeptide (TPR) repeat protein
MSEVADIGPYKIKMVKPLTQKTPACKQCSTPISDENKLLRCKECGTSFCERCEEKIQKEEMFDDGIEKHKLYTDYTLCEKCYRIHIDKQKELFTMHRRFLQLRETLPAEPNVWFSTAEQFRDSGLFDLARLCFNEAINIDDEYLDHVTKGWLVTGNKLISESHYKEAVECFDEVLSLDGRIEDAWLSKGKALDNLEKYSDALVAYDKVLNLNSESPEAWSLKGLLLAKMNNPVGAEKCFDKAMDIKPDSEIVWTNISKYYQFMDDVIQQVECAEHAIEINPNNIAAYELKWDGLMKQEDFNGALRCCDELIRVQPTNGASWKCKADTLVELENYNEAVTIYNKALNLDPEGRTIDIDDTQKTKQTVLKKLKGPVTMPEWMTNEGKLVYEYSDNRRPGVKSDFQIEIEKPSENIVVFSEKSPQGEIEHIEIDLTRDDITNYGVIQKYWIGSISDIGDEIIDFDGKEFFVKNLEEIDTPFGDKKCWKCEFDREGEDSKVRIISWFDSDTGILLKKIYSKAIKNQKPKQWRLSIKDSDIPIFQSSVRIMTPVEKQVEGKELEADTGMAAETELKPEVPAEPEEKITVEKELVAEPSEERNELLIEKKKLKKYRMKLDQKASKLEEDQTKLNTENKELQDKISKFEESKSEFETNKSKFESERKEITEGEQEKQKQEASEREEFQDERSKVNEDKRKIVKWRKKLQGEQETLEGERQKAKEWKVKMKDLDEKWQEDHDQLEQNKAEFEEAQSKFKEQQQSFEEEQNKFKYEKQEWEENIVKQEKEEADHKVDVEKFDASRRELEDKKNTLEKELEHLENNKQTLSGEKEALENDLNQLKEQKDSVETDLTRLKEEQRIALEKSTVDEKFEGELEERTKLIKIEQDKIEEEKKNLEEEKKRLEEDRVRIAEQAKMVESEREKLGSVDESSKVEAEVEAVDLIDSEKHVSEEIESQKPEIEPEMVQKEEIIEPSEPKPIRESTEDSDLDVSPYLNSEYSNFMKRSYGEVKAEAEVETDDTSFLRITIVDSNTNKEVEIDLDEDNTIEETIDSAISFWEKEPGAYVLSHGSEILRGPISVNTLDLHNGETLELIPDPKPELEAEPEAKLEPESEAAPEPEIEAELEPKSEPDSAPTPKDEVKTESEPEPEPAPTPEAEVKPETESEPETESVPVVSPEVETEPNEEMEPEPAPTPEAEIKPEVEPELEPEPVPEKSKEVEAEPEVTPEIEDISELALTSLNKKFNDFDKLSSEEQDNLINGISEFSTSLRDRLKLLKDSGVDVKEIRELYGSSRKSFKAKEYSKTLELLNEILIKINESESVGIEDRIAKLESQISKVSDKFPTSSAIGALSKAKKELSKNNMKEAESLISESEKLLQDMESHYFNAQEIIEIVEQKIISTEKSGIGVSEPKKILSEMKSALNANKLLELPQLKKKCLLAIENSRKQYSEVLSKIGKVQKELGQLHKDGVNIFASLNMIKNAKKLLISGDYSQALDLTEQSIATVKEEVSDLKAGTKDGKANSKAAVGSLDFAWGENYLLMDTKPVMAFTIQRLFSEQNVSSVTISKSSKNELFKKYKFEPDDFICLSEIGDKDTISVKDIPTLGKTLTKIITKSEMSVILIDGFEMFVENNGIEKAMGFLNKLNRIISKTQSILILVLNRKALSEVDINQLLEYGKNLKNMDIQSISKLF